MSEVLILIFCAVLIVILAWRLFLCKGKLSAAEAEIDSLKATLDEKERRLGDDFSELDNMKARLTLSQISPHFVFNTLNTIYYLCEKDIGEAQKAIDDFSKYLRENMDSVKKMEPVPFTEELEHVKRYLEIEKLRYDEDLQVIYDINVTDFKVPALSVQAMVENAVHHGLSKAEHGGSIKISTWEGQETICVMVDDNGVGFDTTEKPVDDRSHTGIENVRSLLDKMCAGKLEIISEKGGGTIAMIRVPKE